MMDRLSPRERMVLGCLAEGLPNKTIADQLGIADATVAIYVKGILRKTGFSNRTRAAVWVKDAEIERLRAGLEYIAENTAATWIADEARAILSGKQDKEMGDE